MVGATLQSPSRQFGGVKGDLAFKALCSQMPSGGYWNAVSTSNDLGFSQVSSRVLTVSHTDSPAWHHEIFWGLPLDLFVPIGSFGAKDPIDVMFFMLCCYAFFAFSIRRS